MPRIYTKDVFNEVLSSTTTQFTNQEDYDFLGRADRISMQLHVTNAAGTTPTLTVKLWGSSDGGKNWVTVATPWSMVSLTVGGVYDSVVDTGSTILPSLLKFEFQLGGATQSAYVKLSVTGRTD
jgi:hypothetical protein